MYTFRDIIKLAAEWNAVCYAEEFIQRFLDDVVELMIVFTKSQALEEYMPDNNQSPPGGSR